MAKHLIYTVTLLILLASATAYPNSSLTFRQNEAGVTGPSTTATLSDAPLTEINLSAVNTATGEAVSVTSRVIPIDLSILVDTSSMCQSRKFDKQMAALIQLLESNQHPDTRVSLATYTSGTLEILARSKPLDELKSIHIDCEPKYYSSSYEKALTHLMEKHKAKQSPSVVWVFTSGNIQTSEATLKMLAEKELYVHFFLYNPVMQTEIAPTVEMLRSKSAKDRILYSVISSDTPFIPEKWMLVDINADFGPTGSRIPLTLKASSGKTQLTTSSLMVEVPNASLRFWVYRNRMAILITLGLLFTVYLGLRLFRFYRKHSCHQCGKTLLAHDTFCYLCSDENEAFLVGQFNLYDAKKQKTEDVFHLRSKITELGTHKKSAIPMLRIKKRRKGCMVRIIREQVGANNIAYKLVRTAEAKSVVIRVNGNHLERNRYLASGDSLQIGFTLFTFVTGTKEPQHETKQHTSN